MFLKHAVQTYHCLISTDTAAPFVHLRLLVGYDPARWSTEAGSFRSGLISTAGESNASCAEPNQTGPYASSPYAMKLHHCVFSYVIR